MLAHFSGTPAPRAFEIYYPDDLQRVLTGGASSGLACSVVRPGDNFDHAIGARNAYGSIGVIIDLASAESLRAVHVGDGGSMIESGVRIFDEKPIDLPLLEKSLAERTEANEWGIRDYITRGIFVADPIEFWSQRHGVVRTDVASVLDTFPGQRVYTFKDGEIVRLHNDGSIQVVDPNEIYPDPDQEADQ